MATRLRVRSDQSLRIMTMSETANGAALPNTRQSQSYIETQPNGNLPYQVKFVLTTGNIEDIQIQCKTPPSSDYDAHDQLVTFDYMLHTLPFANIKFVLRTLEERLVKALASDFLDCKYPVSTQHNCSSGSVPSSLFYLSSQPTDQVDTVRQCAEYDRIPDTECYRINGGFASKLLVVDNEDCRAGNHTNGRFLSSRKRRRGLYGSTITDPGLTASLENALYNVFMSTDWGDPRVTQASFIGITNSPYANTFAAPPTTAPNASHSGLGPEAVAGLIVGVIAAVALLTSGLLIIRLRKATLARQNPEEPTDEREPSWEDSGRGSRCTPPHEASSALADAAKHRIYQNVSPTRRPSPPAESAASFKATADDKAFVYGTGYKSSSSDDDDRDSVDGVRQIVIEDEADIERDAAFVSGLASQSVNKKLQAALDSTGHYYVPDAVAGPITADMELRETTADTCHGSVGSCGASSSLSSSKASAAAPATLTSNASPRSPSPEEEDAALDAAASGIYFDEVNSLVYREIEALARRPDDDSIQLPTPSVFGNIDETVYADFRASSSASSSGSTPPAALYVPKQLLANKPKRKSILKKSASASSSRTATLVQHLGLAGHELPAINAAGKPGTLA